MEDKFDSLNKTFNTDSVEIEPVKEKRLNISKNKNDVDKDYEYTRGQLYSLIEKGQEAINGIMEVAGESASPRAYEVAGQLIKSVADSTDKLMDLQKKLKEVEEDIQKTTNNVTNNSLFVGSTAELSKLLKDGLLNNNTSLNDKS
jgi:predicted  nucleic acid-binding Zn-ribbon protein|tara:strand:+ start:463 stop:897 length:435 start_codon:yes stop_codon:yes gene_type:complete